MNTKQIVWDFFQRYCIQLAFKKLNQKTLTFDQLTSMIKTFGKVWDNRTAKNYIDCMCQNGWLIPDNLEIYEILGKNVINSIYKYKRTIFTITENVTFDITNEEETLSQLLK